MKESMPRRALLATGGLALGGVTAVLELCFLVLGSPMLLSYDGRESLRTNAADLARLEQKRLARFFNEQPDSDSTHSRSMLYLAARSGAGLLGVGVFALILYGAASAVILAGQYLTGSNPNGGRPAEWYEHPIAVLAFGLLLFFLAVQGLVGVVVLERKLARYFFALTEAELQNRRIRELRMSRMLVVDALTNERRRIERDLHDGVQQRLVALGLLLGRARRATDPAHAADLLRQAHVESQLSLTDLRDVAWRVYPIALDEGGLHTALEALAERCGMPVRLNYDLTGEVTQAIERVAYFVASEAVTNTVKHAAATKVEIGVSRVGDRVHVRVTDNGQGGARTSGSGLYGLARRVGAVDGEFTVDSPAGGPTVVEAVLPCG
ncbi:sensor histidine kinase [Amycolatopsis sp. cg5]|uniref:sensor histidine kinase n=1 Tax=Amycolatopsis sp. cg5 TaxID=3238802 RepID=UPI003524DC0B